MADPLSFGSSLDSHQQAIAKKIIERAIEMGVDPRLAVSVAYQESSLRADVSNGSSGEIGIMQVMPKTGKEFGFSKEDLMNPDRNIEAGLTVLKSYINKFEGNPKLGVVAYNAGPNHPFFTGGELPEITKNYVRSLNDYGAFAEASVEPVGEPPITEAGTDGQAKSSSDQTAKNIDQTMAEQEIRQAQIYGAGTGAVLGGGRGLKDLGGSAIQGLGERAAMGAQRVLQPTPITSGMQAPIGAPVGGPEISGGKPVSGSAGFNYGKAFGLSDIEASRATAMGNAPGSADELIKARAAGLERLRGMSPATGMAEDPTRGGLMVPQQTPYTGPRGPGGEIGGAKPPAVSPKQPGTLEKISATFRNLMNTPLMRYAGPAAGGALAGGEFTRAKQALEGKTPDYTTAGLAGLTGAGGLLSMFPSTARIGVPMALTGSALQMARDPEFQEQAVGIGRQVREPLENVSEKLRLRGRPEPTTSYMQDYGMGP